VINGGAEQDLWGWGTADGEWCCDRDSRWYSCWT